MRKDNKVFLISLTILILLGIGVTIIFRQVLFPFDKNIYLIAWIVAYMLLIIQLFYVPTSYSRNTNVSSKHRINAIISSYNEDEKNLKDTINSILNQDYPVQKIFVIDDGSKIPVKQFNHPKIVWLREENSGKRYAQKLAIDMMEEDEVDFILTVDSDSVLEKKATKKMIEEFERSKSLMGITGLVLTSNFRDNILTRIVDLNIAISCVVSRPVRSRFGSLETTSGALSMYRKEILFDNIENYVKSGTYSDDRQLCFYCLLKGDVISLSDLIVNSNMPNTFKGVVKQRIRWSKGSWRFFPKQMIKLPTKKKIFPILSMIETLLILIFFTFIILSIYYKHYIGIFHYVIIRYMVRLSEAVLYVGNEKRMSKMEKIFTLIVITPLEILFTMFILSPIKYISLFYLKDDKWMTR